MSTFSLGTKLVHAVQKEAAMQRPLPLLATASEPVASAGRAGRPSAVVTASVTLVDNDRFSHLVEAVTVEVTAAPGGKRATGGVVGMAQRLAQSATYLTESLQFVETDAGGAAVLRSTPATMPAPRAGYFEATVGERQLSLKRYQPHADKPGRAPVPFCLTDDVLSRLANDAAAVLAPVSSPSK